MNRGVYGVLEKMDRSIDSKPVIEPHEYVQMKAPAGHWFDIHPWDVPKRLAEGWVHYDPPENHPEQQIEIKPAAEFITDSAKDPFWYKDKHKGQTIFILGCSPSLTPEIGQKLMDSRAITIGVNDIFRLIPPNDFIPTYHMHVDYKDKAENEQFSYLNKEHLIKMRESGTVLFLPTNFKLEPTCDLPGEHYFADPTLKNLPLNYDYEEGILRLACSSVSIYQALQLAVIMGGNPIILLGVDFDIEKKGKGFGPVHFYDEYIDVERKSTVDYKRKKAKKYEQMRKEFEFRIDRDFLPELNNRGVLVFNGSLKSKVEIFPKVDIAGFLR